MTLYVKLGNKIKFTLGTRHITSKLIGINSETNYIITFLPHFRC